MNFSLTVTGLIVLVLGKIAQSIGWDGQTVTEVQLQEIMHAVGTIAQIGGLLTAYIGRYRHGDISLFGRKLVKSNVIDTAPPSNA